VPKYQEAFEALLFLFVLALYHPVFVEPNPLHITTVEVLLYNCTAGFTSDEFGEVKNAGTLYYAADF
jgi:hypothetical protein